MITDSYDVKTPPIASPGDFYGEQQQLCDVCIVTFSQEIHRHALARFCPEQVGAIRACNGETPLYLLDLDGKKVGFYLSHVGAAGAATDVIEANWLLGAAKFILFGSAGALQSEKTKGKFVVPDRAYRDEGMSYHYAPPSDYIALGNAPTVSAILTKLGVPHICGGVWTTDAFYRETRGQLEKRVCEGCLAVDMELAGVQAVCDFHGFALYAFLQTGDVLDSEAYEMHGLHEANHDLLKFDLALEIAKRI